MVNDSLVPRHFKLATGPVTIAVEFYVWDWLDEICIYERIKLRALVFAIEHRRGNTPRPSALRTFLALYYRRDAEKHGRITPTLRRRAREDHLLSALQGIMEDGVDNPDSAAAIVLPFRA